MSDYTTYLYCRVKAKLIRLLQDVKGEYDSDGTLMTPEKLQKKIRNYQTIEQNLIESIKDYRIRINKLDEQLFFGCQV